MAKPPETQNLSRHKAVNLQASVVAAITGEKLFRLYFGLLNFSAAAMVVNCPNVTQMHVDGFVFAVSAREEHRRALATCAKESGLSTENGAGDVQGAKTVEPRNEKTKTAEIDEDRRQSPGGWGGTSACRRCSDRLAQWPEMSNATDRKPQAKMKQPSGEMASRAHEAHAAEAAKTARLRALRLAKEAADREAALSAPPPARIPRSTGLRRVDKTRKPTLGAAP